MSGETYTKGNHMPLAELIRSSLREAKTRNIPGTGDRYTTESIAEAIGFADGVASARRVYKWSEEPEQIVRFVRFVELCAREGDPRILQRIAQDAGFSISELPKTPIRKITPAALLADAVSKVSDAARTFASATDPRGAGGSLITDEEFAELDAAVSEAIRVVEEMRNFPRKRRTRK